MRFEESYRSARTRHPGFTLVELLVVIAIIGILVALLLPAVQAAREAGRRMQCSNNLRQLGLASHTHMNQQGHYPSGGWGWLWAGDPNRGFGRKQPGSFYMNLLPFVEQQNVWDLGKGKTGNDLKAACAVRNSTPVFFTNCPTRRRTELYVNSIRFTPVNAAFSEYLARSDYAANAGDQMPSDSSFEVARFNVDCEFRDGTGAGPSSYADGDRGIQGLGGFDFGKASLRCNGVSFQGSEISDSDIEDGTSNTYLYGEKWVSPDDYAGGTAGADNEGAYSGFDNDNFRTSRFQPRQDTPWNMLPSGTNVDCVYGSAHPGVFMVVLCDSSTRAVPFAVDPKIHRNYGHRFDGQATGQLQ